MSGVRTGPDLQGAGWRALSEGDWQRARGCFEESGAGGETPDALEGLGWAGYFLDDDPLTFDARERAYRLYRERGENSSAARVAAWLAADCLESVASRPSPTAGCSVPTACSTVWSQESTTAGSRSTRRRSSARTPVVRRLGAYAVQLGRRPERGAHLAQGEA